MLPRLKLADSKYYYVDFEKGELRNVEDPTDYVRIKDVAPLLATRHVNWLIVERRKQTVVSERLRD